MMVTSFTDEREHIEQFRRECEEAWNYLENHIYGTMLAAMDELGRAGFWTGGNLPIGFIVDRRQKIDGRKNPNYLKYIIYKPHAKVVRWLSDRYWELGGHTLALLAEIERIECLFPAFDESIDVEIIAKVRACYTEVLDREGRVKGYTIKSDKGLRSLLSNVAYIGYWTYRESRVSSTSPTRGRFG